MSDKHVMEKKEEKAAEAWNPFRMLDHLRELRTLPFGGMLEEADWIPRTDVRETEKEYILDIALPGVRKEDVRIEVKDGVLTVTGEKKTEKEEKGKTWLRRETSYGSFMRSFELPEGLHTEDVKASCKDGVLTLTMRKPAEVKTRGVSIKVE